MPIRFRFCLLLCVVLVFGTLARSAQSMPPVDWRDRVRPLVTRFLSAVKDGDEEAAEQCLTQRAVEAMRAAKMNVSPPGSPDAEFAIGEVQVIQTDKAREARVESTWVDGTGEEKRTYQIQWIVRQSKDGLGVAGMATQLFPDQPPLLLNFEKPAEMQQTVHEANARIADTVRELGGDP